VCEEGWPLQCGPFYQLPCAPEQQAVTCYHETLEQIVHADALGFDIAWLAELHF
jgi:alkanesulfonate monooxygenase SsuD/methylene tetrahydromethanopterin reductase-like flavin-dependent oxidoreductase (luciferase family)